MKDKVQAFFVKARMRFQLREVEIKPLAPDEVLVQVKACGVCGWDVLTAQKVAKEWTPIGHEIAGKIAALGSEGLGGPMSGCTSTKARRLPSRCAGRGSPSICHRGRLAALGSLLQSQ